jgi:DNA-binding transcriptional regulator LsrR (DeoR family)
MGRPRTTDATQKLEAGVGLLTPRERFSAILAQFRDGAGTLDQVISTLAQQFPRVKWKREEIYYLLRNGLAEGYISLQPDRDANLEGTLREKFSLNAAAVVPSVYFNDIAQRAARHILSIIGRYVEDGKDKVSIGFASGFSMSHVARALAHLLVNTGVELPHELQFHALSAGFKARFLREDPNFFLAAFDLPALREREVSGREPRKISFVGLYAPSIVRTAQLDEFHATEGIKEALAARDEIDIVVTGASDFDDPNSTLADFYNNKKNSEIVEEREALKNAGIVGHLLYLPLAESGPIEADRHKFILPTVFDLRDLHKLVTDSRRTYPARVVLVAGLRVKTLERKKIISTILHQEYKLITDLVTDQHNAREITKLPEGPR